MRRADLALTEATEQRQAGRVEHRDPMVVVVGDIEVAPVGRQHQVMGLRVDLWRGADELEL
jgi:hypothetical protein